MVAEWAKALVVREKIALNQKIPVPPCASNFEIIYVVSFSKSAAKHLPLRLEFTFNVFRHFSSCPLIRTISQHFLKVPIET